MGIHLIDIVDDDLCFLCNFWSWRPIVELIINLKIIDPARAETLHDAFVGELTKEESNLVGKVLLEKILPTINPNERILMDGSKTGLKDDGVFYREHEEQHKNYSTSTKVLKEFIDFALKSNGFRVG